MKTTLKSLPQKRVHTFSDIKYGIRGRNDAVEALKALVLSIEDKALLAEIDKLKPKRTPQESFIVLIDWLEEKHPGMYFNSKKGEYSLGTTNSGLNQIHMFPMDFLPRVRELSLKMENLLLHAMFKFINYHSAADPVYGGRCYNLEYTLDGLYSEHEDNLEDEQIEFLKEIQYFEKYYEDKMKKIATGTWSEKKIRNALAKLDYPDELSDIADLTLNYLDMCHGKSIDSYAMDALDIFCEANDIPKDEYDNYEFSDGEPVMLTDFVGFVWSGEDKEGDLSYEQHDYQYSLNDYHGHFGTCEYSINLKLTPDISVDKVLLMNNEDAVFFQGITDLHLKHEAIRNKYYFK